MKKGISARSDYDSSGRWCLRIRKQRGTFTLDEITEACREWESDIYAIIIKAYPDEEAQYFPEIDTGDYVTAYRATDFFQEGTG